MKLVFEDIETKKYSLVSTWQLFMHCSFMQLINVATSHVCNINLRQEQLVVESSVATCSNNLIFRSNSHIMELKDEKILMLI